MTIYDRIQEDETQGAECLNCKSTATACQRTFQASGERCCFLCKEWGPPKIHVEVEFHKCSVDNCYAWLQVLPPTSPHQGLVLCHEHEVQLDGPHSDECPLCKRMRPYI